MRSRAFPWFGERKPRGLFCCMSPVEPGAPDITMTIPAGEIQVAERYQFSATMRAVDEQISKVVIGSTLQDEAAGGSYNMAQTYAGYWEDRRETFRSAFVSHFMKQQALEQWQKLMALYGTPEPWLYRGRKIIEHPPFGQGKHCGPKWGQPGRHRRRRLRMEARRRAGG